jgi:CDP-2,3-bis-(O-geranylgeranyl)-sn-glycerol synthase
MIFKFIFDSFWFILPCYVANIVPGFVKKVNFLNFPVDFYKTWKGKRIFGDHKTYRGLFFGILAASIFSFIQGQGFYVGLVIGMGTLFGDLVGSFFKRRLSINPGGKNLLIDDMPGNFFAILFAFLFGMLNLNIYQCVFLLLIGLPLHIGANWLWYLIGIKDVPW